MKNKNGITLIALIITIIVMLILVGVTINVALNGGLFKKAETAKSETQKAIEKEEIMSATIASYDVSLGGVDKAQLDKELEDLLNRGYKKVEEDDTKVIIQGPSGAEYTIDLATAKNDDNGDDNDDDKVAYNKEYIGELMGTQTLIFLETGKFTMTPAYSTYEIPYRITGNTAEITEGSEYPAGTYYSIEINQDEVTEKNEGFVGSMLVSEDRQIILFRTMGGDSQADNWWEGATLIEFNLTEV